MLNWIWVVMIAGGIIYSFFTGTAEAVTEAAFAAATNAVQIIIELCGLMSLWLGMMKIAEASGLMRRLARLVSPIAAFLFPDVPRDHPAFSSIVMNLSANMLGLGNAATPFGLKAMEQLQTLNPDKQTATPAMITFLVLNTSSITFIPTLVISLRSAAGSSAPTVIIGATMLATFLSTTFAICLDRILRYLSRRRCGR